MEFSSLITLCIIGTFATLVHGSFNDIYERQQKNQWFKDGVNIIKQNLKIKPINKKAKGVVIFIGDGMGVSTVTAARILDGQLRKESGEENVLSWETFPNVALSKTYNTNKQTPDSAGTATAFMTGVKARSGVISVNEDVPREDCSKKNGNEVLSLIMMAEQNGLSTGVVSTARITHATPATTYANSPSRDWENDVDVGGLDCPDIASQLIDFPYGDGLEIAMGGGRQNFIRTIDRDDEDDKIYGKRKDGRNLKSEWINKTRDHVYVWNTKGFKQLKPDGKQKVLGLFNYDHMEYEYNRTNDIGGEPSLTEMVEFSIRSLQHNPKGFVLMVESGRIDHGHHASKPILALHDAVQFSKAVKRAKEIVDPDEVLMVVTADHSHVFTLGGYPARGNDILGFTGSLADDNKKYTTLAYANGPGGQKGSNITRVEPTEEQLKDPHYQRQALVPKKSETHGGEDVGIYSHGPQAHLLRGVVEQNVIFHVLDYALCLSESKKSICRTEGLLSQSNGSGQLMSINWNLVFLLPALVLIANMVKYD